MLAKFLKFLSLALRFALAAYTAIRRLIAEAKAQVQPAA